MLTLEKTQVWPLRASQMTGKHVGHPATAVGNIMSPFQKSVYLQNFRRTFFFFETFIFKTGNFLFFGETLIHWIMGYPTFFDFGNFLFWYTKNSKTPHFASETGGNPLPKGDELTELGNRSLLRS